MPRNYFYIFVALLPFCFIFSCKKNEQQVKATRIYLSKNEDLNAVQFLNDSIGFICGGTRFTSSVIYQTKDAGNTWTEKTLTPNCERRALYGIDVNAKGKVVIVGMGGTMHISNDSGNTFNYKQLYYWYEYKDVALRDNDSMLICGSGGFNKGYLTTLDQQGNYNNNKIIDSTNYKISSIDFVSSKVGYACGYGTILKTTDGGITWQHTTAENDNFKDLSWKNNIGIAIGYEGSILKTSNEGQHWETIKDANVPLKKKQYLNAITALNDQTFIIVGEKGLVLLSKDGGNNWNKVSSFTSKNLHGVARLTDNSCVVVGDEGLVYNCTF
jgi:photosystem II stability/assembly factor-like uncharacterized protein